MPSRRGAPALLAVSMGDPAGVGPEVILKAAAAMAARRGAPALVVIGDAGVMRQAARRLGAVPAPRPWLPGDERVRPADGLAVLEIGRLGAAAHKPGAPSVAGAHAAYRYIVEGARMAMAGEADALVTAPINKQWLNRAGHHFPGHSELLAELSCTRLWRMMFAGDQLRLALVTVHMGLARVSRALSSQGVLDTIRLLARHLTERLGMNRPRIGVLGFNPHAGEHGLFGDEEARVIVPAIRRARRAGIDARGPLAPDTAFIRPAGEFSFDAAVAMYHDQGLIALKTLEFERAVNVTLGLPFVRTSPDHGTAYDIAGCGTANGASMLAAMEYAWRAVRGPTMRARTVREMDGGARNRRAGAAAAKTPRRG
ncbi:MAG TPA: 4-hydroxythreonine-4-phosphate dehydrogenase PdxA [Candidatus Binataceae bacterium]|nr:4-hydroxythreonine-4-phosphate dehydrogenase PdxA [Candidatus Binataceae bacterium]